MGHLLSFCLQRKTNPGMGREAGDDRNFFLREGNSGHPGSTHSSCLFSLYEEGWQETRHLGCHLAIGVSFSGLERKQGGEIKAGYSPKLWLHGDF